ncbi:MAG: ATP-binding cassette domain-containing protein [Paludibacteraceae bacterium]|nr:ATP-binding cassette domain-containing protein [Prevotella sp.]MBP3466134.1 ATP-binding cassette domain-containing protein [Paludibacteraceae bacterium]
MSTAIEFNHISKQYRLGLVSTKTLTSDLNRWWQMNVLRKEDPYLKVGETNDRSKKALSDFVWALKDIDFKVEQGDVVGIIGKNGAGKSTLLKLLSRVTTPTTGTIKARGRIASLLEVGTGFHSELTGRENIYMNGAILGMSKQEINRKLDEIVDFSGCERYIDTPVKRYSSGMMVRLGFAVAAHLDPEILVVDEVLAVGDAEFQKKAIGKMKDVSKGEGRTVLFVSHNMESVQRLCTKGVLLKDGMLEYQGTVSDTIAIYQKMYVLQNRKQWLNPTGRQVEGLRINEFSLKIGDNILDRDVKSDDELCVEIDFDLQKEFPDMVIGVSVFDEQGRYIYRTLNIDVDDEFNRKLKVGRNLIRAKLPIDMLRSGLYNVQIDASRHNVNWLYDPYNETESTLTFIVDRTKSFSKMFSTSAVVAPRVKWELV